MRPLFDDFEEFAFDDSSAVKRLLREQQKEERRHSFKRAYSPDEDSFLDEMDSYDEDDDYEEFGDYNEDEFDNYSGLDS